MFCFLIWNVSMHLLFGCLIFPVFFGMIFLLNVALCLRRRQKCSLMVLQYTPAFPAAVWPVSWADCIVHVCTDLSCVLTCHARTHGAVSISKRALNAECSSWATCTLGGMIKRLRDLISKFSNTSLRNIDWWVAYLKKKYKSHSLYLN